LRRELILISIHIEQSPQAVPLATSILKSFLESHDNIRQNLNISIPEFYMNQSIDEIFTSLPLSGDSIIGFSVYTWNRKHFTELAGLIKKHYPSATVFAGGAEATASPITLLNEGNFSFVISGEGEIPLLKSMEALLLGKTQDGIEAVYTASTDKAAGERSTLGDNLDRIPSPYLNGILKPENYKGILWELSRGCPFNCGFCFESRGDSGIRYYSMDRLKSELKLFEEKKVNQIFVLDPTFNYREERTLEILGMIKDIAPTVHYTFEIRAEFITRQMVELFSEINCSLQIGLQSTNQNSLKKINRSFNEEKFTEKISMLNEYGIVFGMDIIYGLPGDDINSFMGSIDYALWLQPNHLDIFPLSVLPGTDLYEKAVQYSLNFKDEAPYTLINTDTFSADDMTTAHGIKQACDIFYNKGGAVGWMFMICETLEIQPSQLLMEFSLFLNSKRTALTDESVIKLQCEFTRKLFSGNDLMPLNRAMEDIIRIHGAIKKAVSQEPSVITGKLKPEPSGRYIKAGGMTFLRLNYFFDDLMQVGEYNLYEFIENFRPNQNMTLLFNYCGDAKPVVIDGELAAFIDSFNGKLTLDDVVKKNSSLNKKEALDFTAYALSEGIIRKIS